MIYVDASSVEVVCLISTMSMFSCRTLWGVICHLLIVCCPSYSIVYFKITAPKCSFEFLILFGAT